MASYLIFIFVETESLYVAQAGMSWYLLLFAPPDLTFFSCALSQEAKLDGLYGWFSNFWGLRILTCLATTEDPRSLVCVGYIYVYSLQWKRKLRNV